MNTPISCPDATRWQALLEGVIPEEEQADLNNHLETCAACQQTLERLAAGEHRVATCAASTMIQRSQLDPCRVIPPRAALPADSRTRGTSPA